MNSKRKTSLLKPILISDGFEEPNTGLRKVKEEDPFDEEDETFSRKSFNGNKIIQSKKPFSIKKQKITNQKSSIHLGKSESGAV